MQDLLRAIAFIALAGGIFIGAMLVEAWYLKRKTGDANYSIRETLTNMITGASYKLVDGIAIALFIQFAYTFVFEIGFQWDPEISWYSIVALVLITDFLFYFLHVAMHKVRWFWGSHFTHHSGTRMNLSTALRQNFTLALNGGWVIWWIPLALIGFDKNWALIAIELNLVYQFFIHTEAFSRIPLLEKIFNMPAHHRVHHGCNPAQIDRNFGGILIIWDKIFGTFIDERNAGKIRYGVSRMPTRPLNPWSLQVDEYISMGKDLWNFKDWRILVKHPEWARDTYGTQDGYERLEAQRSDSNAN